jgi:aspartate aminotransferase
LGVGAYRTEEGKPLVLPSVRTAEYRILKRDTDKEYAPISGVPSFIECSLKFGYGENANVLKEGRVAAVQAISGTGGCRLAGEFLHKFFGEKNIHVPNPTWGNHIAIFKNACLDPVYYPYYESTTKSVNFSKFLDAVIAADNQSLFLLHACAHNPTGCDLSKDQWGELSSIMKEKQHIVLFDSAYQGFASGDPEADAFAIRKFVSDGHQIILCQSYAKVCVLFRHY